MSSTKIFIGILFLVAILFVISINLGAFHSDNQKFQQPSWLNGLGTTLVSAQPLKSADLSSASASCLGHGKLIVQAGGTCAFTIKKSIFTVRVARLHLVEGVSAIVWLSQEQMLTVQHKLVGDSKVPDDLKIYPGKAQGMLVIQCTDAGNRPACLLELQ